MSVIHEIRVSTQEGIGLNDGVGNGLKNRLNAAGFPVTDAQVATVYLFEGITSDQAAQLAHQVLTDPTQHSVVNGNIFSPDHQTLLIGYPQEITHPATDSLFEVATLAGATPAAVTQLREIALQGDLTPSQLEAIGDQLKDQLEIVFERVPDTLVVDKPTPPVEFILISHLDEAGLRELSERRRSFLDIEEMQTIQRHYRDVLDREPTDLEWEMIAQTWSEHNVHKTFKAEIRDEQGQRVPPLLRRIMYASTPYFERVGVVSAFKDNAGGIKLGIKDGEEYVVCAKLETHNHPTSIGPVGGSATGIGGVIRDIMGFGKGAHPFMGIEINLTGLPYTKPDEVLSGCLHPMTHIKGMVDGESSYGNQYGIATPLVYFGFDPGYGLKTIMMGGAIGIIPKRYVQKEEPQDDLVILVGGKTGRDGIHGATVSSGEMTAKTMTVDPGSVQIGDAIMEKRTADALEECRDRDLIRTITDCGGGGLSSAVGELGAEVGVEVNLAEVPLKYKGLAPWEIWLSESQERMAVAVAPEHWEEFRQICEKWGAPVAKIGRFTGDKQLTLHYGDGNVVAQLPMDFLHHGRPKKTLQMKYEPYPEDNRIPEEPLGQSKWLDAYKRVLGHLNICSKQPIHVRYDQSVQGMMALASYTGVNLEVPNDGVALTPVYGKPNGVVVAHALHPMLNRIDPYEGAIWAVASALSKLTAIGGTRNRTTLIDNFCWPKLNTPQHLANISRSVDGLCAAVDATKVPFSSGKDSISMTYTDPETKIRIDAPPVINVTAVGTIDTVEHTVTCDIKSAGKSTLCLVGKLDTDNLGASAYFDTQGIINSHAPRVDLETLPNVLDTMHEAIQTGKVKSCKAIGEGGLATTLAQMCFGGDCGADIDLALSGGGKRTDFAFFSETAGCFVVEVASEEEAHDLFGNVPHQILGKTTADKAIRVKTAGQELFRADLYDLKEAWQKPMEEVAALWQ